jgi:hypothetical protein
MPQRKRPLVERVSVEDESTGNPPERHGPHQPWDEALPGRGSTRGGLDKYGGAARRGSAKKVHRHAPGERGGKQNRGKPKGH